MVIKPEKQSIANNTARAIRLTFVVVAVIIVFGTNYCDRDSQIIRQEIDLDKYIKISGIQKLTLLDYPEHMACTLFVPGCNFRCPFCHNSELLRGDVEFYDEREILDFLKKRAGVLEEIGRAHV